MAASERPILSSWTSKCRLSTAGKRRDDLRANRKRATSRLLLCRRMRCPANAKRRLLRDVTSLTRSQSSLSVCCQPFGASARAQVTHLNSLPGDLLGPDLKGNCTADRDSCLARLFNIQSLRRRGRATSAAHRFKRSCGLEVDDELELGRCLHACTGKSTGFSPLRMRSDARRPQVETHQAMSGRAPDLVLISRVPARHGP